MADNKLLSLVQQSQLLVNIEIIFPGDRPGGGVCRPIRHGGEELSGHLKVSTRSASSFEVDLAFQGQLQRFGVEPVSSR